MSRGWKLPNQAYSQGMNLKRLVPFILIALSLSMVTPTAYADNEMQIIVSGPDASGITSVGICFTNPSELTGTVRYNIEGSSSGSFLKHSGTPACHSYASGSTGQRLTPGTTYNYSATASNNGKSWSASTSYTAPAEDPAVVAARVLKESQDTDFRDRQNTAQAAAQKESQAWNAANPGKQKCVQWGQIVHANGVSTTSGGVCANPVPSTATTTPTPTTSTTAESSTATTTTTTPTPTTSTPTTSTPTTSTRTESTTATTSSSSDPFPGVADRAEIPGTRVSGAPGDSEATFYASSAYLSHTCPTGSGRGIGVDLAFTSDRSKHVRYVYCVKTWRPTPTSSETSTATTSTSSDTSTATTSTSSDTSNATTSTSSNTSTATTSTSSDTSTVTSPIRSDTSTATTSINAQDSTPVLTTVELAAQKAASAAAAAIDAANKATEAANAAAEAADARAAAVAADEAALELLAKKFAVGSKKFRNFIIYGKAARFMYS